MKTTDLFAFNRSSKRLNESLSKTFGRKLNLETFSVEQLEDARNKLRTQIYTARSSSNFNETVENDALTQAQFMHDAIVAELAERDEPIVDNTQLEEAQAFYVMLLGPRSGQRDPYHGPFNSPDEAQAWIDTESPNPEDYEVGDFPAGQFGQYDNGQPVQEGMTEGGNFDEQAVVDLLKKFDEDMNEIGGYGDPDYDKIMAALSKGDIESAIDEIWNSYSDQDGGELRNIDSYIQDLESEISYVVQGSDDEGGDTDDAYALASAGHGGDEDYGTFNQGESLQNEAYINNAEDAINLLAAIRAQSKMAERGGGEPVRPNQLVNDLWDVMQWIEANMKESIETESKNTGDNMRNLREGEIQQASAIVTAKTMVDRVGRWIEELSGMENDTLLQLGDSIRDEMGQEQAKQFISASAPAIQSALENLKATREALASSVRALTGEEQSAEMLGGEPGADMAAPAEPDAMNAEPGMDMGDEVAGDDFDAAEPAAGGLGDAGREQRESIDRQSRLMKVLAG
jgi:hypothetical protein